MVKPDCTMGAENRQRIEALKDRTIGLHEVDEQQWTAINKIRDRLPTWATLFISLLTALLGVAVTIAIRR